MQSDGKLAFNIREVVQVTGIGRSTLFKHLKDGRLKARRANGRLLVLRADLERFLANLPEREEEAA